MASKTWGSTAVLVSYTDDYVYYDTVTYPTGRTMFNGAKGVILNALTAYVSGRGASRTISLQIGGQQTANFTVAAESDASSVGWRNIGPTYTTSTNGQRFRINMSGAAYFGRSTSGTSHGAFGDFAGTLYGSLRYDEAPSAPRTPTATPLVGTSSAVVNWAPPTEDGDTPITGYTVQAAMTSAFTTIVATANVGNVLVAQVDGLPPGKVYFRVLAKNAVTTAAGTTSVASSYTSTDIAAGTYVGTGSTWPSAYTYVSDGTDHTLAEVWIGDGTTWKPAG